MTIEILGHSLSAGAVSGGCADASSSDRMLLDCSERTNTVDNEGRLRQTRRISVAAESEPKALDFLL